MLNLLSKYTPTEEQIRRAISLQVTAVFAPERFNLAPDFRPQDDTERHVLYLLQKYHPNGKWLKRE